MLTATRRGSDRRQDDLRVLVPRLPAEAEVILLVPALVSTPQGTSRAAAGERYATSHADASRLVAMRIARFPLAREART